MKKVAYLAIVLSVFLATFTLATEVAAEQRVSIIYTTPAKTSKHISSDVKVQVMQIDDKRHGIVCYGLIPTSDAGRFSDGGYPGTSISCVKAY